MSWAEFRFRSIAFREQQKQKMLLAREIGYEVHTLKYLFSKHKPPSKRKWWPIDGEPQAAPKKVTDEQKQAFLNALERKKQKQNG